MCKRQSDSSASAWSDVGLGARRAQEQALHMVTWQEIPQITKLAWRLLRGKYICPVFFIGVFQDMDLSCSWGGFWLCSLWMQFHCLYGQRKGDSQTRVCTWSTSALYFLRALQFSEVCTGSFCREFKVGCSCLKSWPSWSQRKPKQKPNEKAVGREAVLLSCSVRLFVFAGLYAVCSQHESVFQLSLLWPDLVP